MAIEISQEQVCQLRLRAQRLHPQLEPPSGVAQVVRDLCGVQAQLESAAALAIRARSQGLTAAEVLEAQVEARSVVRTWGPRGTLHLLPTEDLRWLLRLFAPVFIAGRRRRYRQLGLDEDTLDRGVRGILDLLASQGPMTRTELVEGLARRGMRVEGQARPYLLGHAALKGLICHGPDRGSEPTYVLLEEWVGEGLSLQEEEAHLASQLAIRYLEAFGPATPKDQAAWSGMPVSAIRSAWDEISDRLIEVEIESKGTAYPTNHWNTSNVRQAWMLKAHSTWLDKPISASLIVRLLPGFDPYLLGYQNRDLIVPLEYSRRVNAGGGMLNPTLLIDGRVAGTWKMQQKKNRVEITLEPFGQLSAKVQQEIDAEVKDVARFLEKEVSVIQYDRP